MSQDQVRKAGLMLVMLGAMSVSVRGQVEAVWPVLGGMSIVLALTNDAAALLALNEVTSSHRRDVRRWAWMVLLLSGGTGAGLNTWHAVITGALPLVWAIVVGAGPTLLTMVLSHLVALTLDDHAPARPEQSATADPTAPTAAAARTAEEADREPVVPDPVVPVVKATAAVIPRSATATSRAGQVTTALPSSGIHPVLAVVGPQRVPSAGGRDLDPRVAGLVSQLRAGDELTGASVGDQLGCSERTGRRLLRQAQEVLTEASDVMAERGTG